MIYYQKHRSYLWLMSLSLNYQFRNKICFWYDDDLFSSWIFQLLEWKITTTDNFKQFQGGNNDKTQWENQKFNEDRFHSKLGISRQRKLQKVTSVEQPLPNCESVKTWQNRNKNSKNMWPKNTQHLGGSLYEFLRIGFNFFFLERNC